MIEDMMEFPRSEVADLVYIIANDDADAFMQVYEEYEGLEYYVIRLFFKKEAYAMEHYANWTTITHLIGYFGAVWCFRYLIKKNIDFSQVDGNNRTFIYYALEISWYNVIVDDRFTELIKSMKYPIHIASSSTDINCFKWVYDLVEHDDSFRDLTDEDGNTISKIVLLKGCNDIIDFCLEQNLIEISQASGNYCILAKNDNMFRKIFNELPDYNFDFITEGKTDIICAIEEDLVSAVRLICTRASYSIDDIEKFWKFSVSVNSCFCAFYLESLGLTITEYHLRKALVCKNEKIVNHILDKHFSDVESYEFLKEILSYTKVLRNISFISILQPLKVNLEQLIIDCIPNKHMEKRFMLFYNYLCSFVPICSSYSRNTIIIILIKYLINDSTIYDVLSIAAKTKIGYDVVKFVVDFKSYVSIFKCIPRSNGSPKLKKWEEKESLAFWIGYLTFSTNYKVISAVVETKSVAQCQEYEKNLYESISNDWSIEEDLILWNMKSLRYSWKEIAEKILSKNNNQCKLRDKLLIKEGYLPFTSGINKRETEIALENEREIAVVCSSNDNKNTKENHMSNPGNSLNDGIMLNLKKENKRLRGMVKSQDLLIAKYMKKINKLESKLSNYQNIQNIAEQDTVTSKILYSMIKNANINKYHRTYDDNVMDFSSIVLSISPATYRFIRNFLALPSVRTIETKFSRIKTVFSEYLQNVNQITEILRIIKSRYELNEVIDVTLSTDAFTIEIYKKDCKNAFIFDILPLCGSICTFPVHFEFVQNGSANNKINAIVDNVALIIEQNGFNPRFFATDGDSFWQKRHDYAFNSLLTLYKSADFDEITSKVNQTQIWPITDLLHVLKNTRNRIMNHTITLSMQNCDHLVTAELLNDCLNIGPPLTDYRFASKLIDRYPLQIFTIENLKRCIDNDELNLAVYLLAPTMWCLAHLVPKFSKASRLILYKLAFTAYMFSYNLSEEAPANRIKSIFSKDSMATYIYRQCSLKRIINTIAGHISVLKLEIQNIKTERISTHPSENTIGTIRLGSYFYHSGSNMLNVAVKGSLTIQSEQRLGLSPIVNKRANISGTSLDDESIAIECNFSIREIVLGLLQKSQLMTPDEDTNIRFLELNKVTNSVAKVLLENNIKQQRHYATTLCSASNIIARLVSSGKKVLKEKNIDLTEGELELVSYLFDKSYNLDVIQKYLPHKSMEMIKRSLNEPSQYERLHTIQLGNLNIGLPDLGDSSYLTSAIQMIISSRSVFQFIVNVTAKKGTLLLLFQQFFKCAQFNSCNVNQSYINLSKQIEYHIYSLTNEEVFIAKDVINFSEKFIAHLAFEMNPLEKKEFYSLFEAKQAVYEICSADHTIVSSQRLHFINLNFSIDEEEISLIQLIQEYGNQVKNSDFFCTKCKAKKCQKTSILAKLAGLVFLKINRYISKVKRRNNSVIVPKNICLSDENDKESNYILCSMIIHQGESVYCGHYTSYKVYDNACLEFFDEKINVIDLDQLLESEDFRKNIYALSYSINTE